MNDCNHTKTFKLSSLACQKYTYIVSEVKRPFNTLGLLPCSVGRYQQNILSN